MLTSNPSYTLYVYGFIEYKDIFKINRKTYFGYYMHPESILKKKYSYTYIENHINFDFTWSPIANINKIE